jgi:2-polyprenyl-3-methyl-5-hydroxy-6-metoxy-1,4-benzoquinol methylase
MTSEAPPLFEDPAGTWNARYEGSEFRFGTAPNAWLEGHASLFQPDQRVLCVADGEGRNSVWLAGRGLEVDAFDIAEAGVAKARRLAVERGVKVNCTVSDCDSFTWQPRHYDAVVIVFIQFADPAKRARIFANAKRCLKPGGFVAVQGYTTKQLEYKTGGRRASRTCTRKRCFGRPLATCRSRS